VKHENHTPLGAFKVRGGIVYVSALRTQHPEAKGLVAATRGNHGQSLAFAARLFGFKAVVVVPHGNSEEKNAAMQALGAELIVHGQDFQESLEYAQELATERNLFAAASFHPLLVKGISSYGLEMFRGMPKPDVVYVPIGLGSGICGVMAARDALGLKTAVVGVVSSCAPAYSLSFRKREPISHAVTTRIADGMACRKPDESALERIWRGAERIVEVTDDEVEAAMRAYFSDTHNVAEGAGAAALAAATQDRGRLTGKRVAVVLSGGNVDRAVFARVLSAS
jgi:threonine dehydratase